MEHLFLQNIIEEAIERKASDLHLSVGVPPAFRINKKILYSENHEITYEDNCELVNSILKKEDLEKLDKMGYQNFTLAIPEVGRFRGCVFKQRNSFSFVFRIGMLEISDNSMLELPGFAEKIINLDSGLVIITGEKGCGKSTTAAFIIDEIRQNFKKHIVTIEDPIEFLYKHDSSIVTQKEVGIDIEGIDAGIEASIHEDSDLVYISRLESPNSILKILELAQMGKLVILTMNTSSIINTLQLLINGSPNDYNDWCRYQIADSLKYIIAQKRIQSKDDEMVSAFEVFNTKGGVADLIRNNEIEKIQNIIENSKKLGMQTMDMDILRLYEEGIIEKSIAKENLVNTRLLK